MGASTFYNIAIGRYNTPNEAFLELIDRARYEYGHGGYTGTIAEKDSFRLVPVAKRIDPFKLVEEYINDESGFWADKWGPAACVEIQNTYLQKLKERRGYKGKKGIKAYIFFGWASD